ncbi:MAG: N-6 DNA methylase [Chitinispirillales bacterium]|jgi:type I restriction-modification system DNA methylase subunit/predicted type IV restriction endonuclease|nr:N-6 DNA methylase [Chitinispirillales bacterium]
MTTKEEAREKIVSLVLRFDEQKESYKNKDYNETQTRRDFIDPFWEALGWDVDNESGSAESYREVIHEDRVKVGGATKAPDYSFRLAGGKRLFFLEAKRPCVEIKDDVSSAYQIRRYGWNAQMPISVITDFEEFAIYDCTQKPKPTDKATVARIKYLTYKEYLQEFDFIWDTFSKERILKGSFDKYVRNDKIKKGTTTVDRDFLDSLDKWRIELARNIALRNNGITEDELNFAVQNTIDRVIFLRIAEDRGAEQYGDMRSAAKAGDCYKNLLQCFYAADQKYNSGLFDFRKDQVSGKITIDNKVIKHIISELYYPECPYEFSVMSVEILGSAYEQFLGKQILLSKSGRAVIEEKPEVRKAGGVYYTPQYIVDYIVNNTVGKLIENKTPQEISKIKIVDPACGSGSFLIGAYQYLLDWHKDYYTKKLHAVGMAKTADKAVKDNPLIPTGELTTAEKKRILLNNIYGVDLDDNAVEVTKLSLLLKCLEGETKETLEAQTKIFHARVLPMLDDNIKSGNSLIDIDYYENELDLGEERKIKPFSWEKTFPDVFYRNVPIDKKLPLMRQYQKVKKSHEEAEKLIASYMTVEEPGAVYHSKQNSGFDCVLGNPPYVKVSDKKVFDYFSGKYIHQDYQQDLYLLFLERYNKLLAIGGMLGVIIPNTWLQSVKFRNIRRYLTNEYYWHRIMHINEHIFKAVVDTHVLIFEKNSYTKNCEIGIDIFEKGEIRHHQFTDQSSLPDNGDVINVLSSEDEKGLFEKIKEASVFIGDVSVVYNGVKPFEKGKGNPPQTAKTLKEKPFVCEGQRKPKGRNWKPLLRGSLINRYVDFWDNDSWIQYGEWLAAPRNHDIFEAEEKIVVRQTGDSIIATIIGAKIICRDNLHIIISTKINHKFLLGIINSKLTNFYYYQINPERGEALAQVKKSHVERLPIPKNVSKEQETEIIKHVNRLLKFNKDLQSATLPGQIERLQSRIAHSEDQINAVVYALYGLTEEEIKIVEQ